MLCTPYYICAFQTKDIQTIPHRGAEGEGKTVCFGCTLPLWVFIGVCRRLSSSPLHHALSPPSSDYGVLSCHLWTTFKCTFTVIWSKWSSSHHCWHFQAPLPAILHSKNPLLVVKRLPVCAPLRRSREQSCWAHSTFGHGEGSEQQGPKQRWRKGLLICV